MSSLAADSHGPYEAAPTAPGFEQHQRTSVPGGDADPFETQMHADMLRMMHDMHAPGYTGNRDVDFLTMMIPHHQGAIDMARLALIHGNDPLTRALAEEIIASQQSEIQAMRGRLAEMQARSITDKEPFPALSGTRGPK